MRRGKQKVRISTSVTEYGEDNGTVSKRPKRLSSGKGRQKSKGERDPLALPAKRTKGVKTAVKTKAARKQPAQPKEYEVEKIVSHRQTGRDVYYRIRWKGWAAKDDTWQTEDDLNCDAILKKYQKTMPAASSPKKRGRPSLKAVTARSPGKRSPKKKPAGSRGVAEGRVSKKKGPRKTLNSKGSRGPPAKRGRKPKSDKEWEVEEVVAVRTTEQGIEEFYIKWKGYSSEENTWEPADNVANCGKAIDRFRQAQDGDGVAPLEDDDDEDDQPKENGDAGEEAAGTSAKSPVTTEAAAAEDEEDDEEDN